MGDPRLVSRRWLLLCLGLAAGSAAVGVLISPYIRSPAQVAADTAPPEPGLLTAEVEHRVIRSTLVARGSVVPDRSVDVFPTSAHGATRLIVTGVRVKKDDQVKPGQVLVVVSGRPVIALPGAVPAYRDLRPGAEGTDVVQLQQALRALGILVSDKGRFGESTKRAVIRLYEGRGFGVATTGPDDELAVKVANQRVQQAQAELDLALASSARAAEVDALRAALRAAQQERNDLVARTGSMLPLNEVVYVPTFPARVTKVGAEVGAEVNGPLLTLASGRLLVRADLNPADRPSVHPGQTAEVYVDETGATFAGVVSSVGDVSESSDGRTFAVSVEASLPDTLAGKDVRLTILLTTTAQPVLVVPLSAVYATADGTTVVMMVRDGHPIRVEVQPGTAADGFVEIRSSGQPLAAGELVVVGVQ